MRMLPVFIALFLSASAQAQTITTGAEFWAQIAAANSFDDARSIAAQKAAENPSVAKAHSEYRVRIERLNTTARSFWLVRIGPFDDEASAVAYCTEMLAAKISCITRLTASR